MRRPVIAGNWKMNKIIAEAEALAKGVLRNSNPDVDVILVPPFTALSKVKEALTDPNFKLGGQNIYTETSGAYTGEISASMLKDAGCDYVILGHSERRKLFWETDSLINKKVKTAISHGLKPIFCIGESLEDREGNKTPAVIRGQLKRGLDGLNHNDMAKVVIAYEPVWAIGTGQNATPKQVQETHRFIRQWIDEAFGSKIADDIQIIYGGSVNAKNSGSILEQEDVDGALVGGASLETETFCAIISSVKTTKVGKS